MVTNIGPRLWMVIMVTVWQVKVILSLSLILMPKSPLMLDVVPALNIRPSQIRFTFRIGALLNEKPNPPSTPPPPTSENETEQGDYSVQYTRRTLTLNFCMGKIYVCKKIWMGTTNFQVRANLSSIASDWLDSSTVFNLVRRSFLVCVNIFMCIVDYWCLL